MRSGQVFWQVSGEHDAEEKLGPADVDGPAAQKLSLPAKNLLRKALKEDLNLSRKPLDIRDRLLSKGEVANQDVPKKLVQRYLSRQKCVEKKQGDFLSSGAQVLMFVKEHYYKDKGHCI